MGNLSQKARVYVSLGIVLLIILLSLSIIFYGVYQVYFAPATLFSHDFQDAGSVEDYFEERIVNVAILGLHNRNEDNTFGDIYYVDTILIASINFDQDNLTLLAVPRDSYVKIACSERMDRIRQSYSYGYNQAGETERHEKGMHCAIETIRNLLDGLDLHYYIAMDIQGLKQLIDSMGGVYFDVEEPMIGFTPQESLDKGPQLLDGQGYMTYLTYREPDTRDDLNRMSRQKELLLATFKYFQEMGLFSYVVPTYSAYREHVITDLSFNQVAALALFAGERLESDAIRDYSLEGEYFTIDNGKTFYLELDQESKNEIIEKLSSVTGGEIN
ncbi:MAG: LCP family protein [Bacillota bacterium]|nr:LCP family protein [Bacillota bacterium]